MPQISPTQLRTALSKLFSIGELRTLCFDLGIDYEDLEGAGKSGKALALVQYGQRHGRYDELVYRVQQLRPHANLGTAVAAPPNIVSQQGPQQVTNMYVGGDYVGGDKVGGDKVGGDNIHAGGDVSKGDMTKQTAGGDIIIGGQPIPQTREEFDKLLAELKELLGQAIQAGEIENERDAEAAVEDLQDAAAEAQAEKPRASRLKRYLENVSETLQGSAMVAEAAGQVGKAVIKAAPIAAALTKLAQVIF